jgi:hypothetical protein
MMVTGATIGALAIALVSVEKHNAPQADQSVNGQVMAYEMSSQTLTLRTANGDQYFLIPDGTPLHEGAKILTLSDLASASGCPTKVWYRDVKGQMIASQVRISCNATVSREMPSRR